MEYIRIFMRVTSVLIIVGNINCQSVQELLSTLSDKINNIDQSSDKKFEASINKINERLDRIENVLGINDQDLEGVKKGEAIWTDIQNTKHTLRKAFKNEKQHLNRFVSEYEERFDELKHDVKDMLFEINSTYITQKVNEKMLENSNNLNESLNQLEKITDEQFRDVLSKIDVITHNNTMTNMDMALYQQTTDQRFFNLENNQSQQETKVSNLDSGVSSLQNRLSMHDTRVRNLDGSVSSLRNRLSQQDTKVRTLDSSVSSLQNRLSEQDTKVRTLDSDVSSLESSLKTTDLALIALLLRIDSLEGTKVAFSAFLQTTTQYDDIEVIIFDGAIRNYGNHYSTSTGKFTAPKSGTYLFSLSVEGTRTMKAYAHIVSYENGSKANRGQAYAEKAVDVTASNSIVYYMSEGEQMWVESSGSCEFFNYRTTFMGVLLD